MFKFMHEQYKSHLDFIEEVKNSDDWQSVLEYMESRAKEDPEALRKAVIEECNQNMQKEIFKSYWILFHDAERTIKKLWEEPFTYRLFESNLMLMLRVEWVEQNCPEPGKTKQFDPLHTPKAKELFAKLRKAKKLDSHDKPLGLTTSEIGVLANIIAAELEVKNKWVAFGKKWNIDKNVLRSYYNNGMELKKIGAFIDEINKLIH